MLLVTRKTAAPVKKSSAYLNPNASYRAPAIGGPIPPPNDQLDMRHPDNIADVAPSSGNPCILYT